MLLKGSDRGCIRTDRLNVQDVGHTIVVRPNAEQGVVLKRQADHGGNGVLGGLGEIRALLGGSGR